MKSPRGYPYGQRACPKKWKSRKGIPLWAEDLPKKEEIPQGDTLMGRGPAQKSGKENVCEYAQTAGRVYIQIF